MAVPVSNHYLADLTVDIGPHANARCKCRGFHMAASAFNNSTLTNVLTIRVCLECDKLLTEASDSIRRHGGDMTVGMFLIHRGDLTEEARQDFKTRLVGSFKEAQSAWDAYRAHLMEHGILSELSLEASTVHGEQHDVTAQITR